MADFNVDAAKPQGAGTQPLEPVRNHVTPMQNPWLGAAVGVGGMLINYMQQQREQEKQQQIDAVVSAFTKDQASLSDAVAQGSISPAQASARARSNFTKYAAQYPQLVEQLKKSNSALVDSGDLGNFQDAAKAQADRENKLMSDMQASGYPIYPGMDPKLLEQFKSTYLQTQKIRGDFEFMSKVNSERRSQSTEDRAIADWTDKQNTAKLLANLGSIHGVATVDFISRDLATATSPEQKKAAEIRMAQHFTMIDSAIASLSGTHPELASNYKNMFDELKRTARDVLSGKMESQAREDYLKDFKNKLQIMALADPRMQANYATNALIPNMVSVAADGNSSAMNVMASFVKNGGIQTPVVGNKEIESDIYNGFIKTQQKLLNGKQPNKEQATEQLKNGVNNTLTQVGRAIGNDLRGEDLVQFAAFAASPEFGTMVDKKIVTKEQANQAKTAFQYLYEQQVANSVVQKLGEKLPDGTTYGDSASLVWVGNHVAVEKKFPDVKPGWTFGTSGAFKNASAERVREVQDEQRKFASDLETTAKAINLVVRAGAHLEGTRDYHAYWEENKHRIVPGYFQEPDEGKQKQLAKRTTGSQTINVQDMEQGYVMNTPDGGQWEFQGGDATLPTAWKRIK